MSAPRACAHELTLSESPFSADNSTVEAAEQAWRPLGELLLSKNLIARTELDQALSEQEETGKLLGAILVDRGYISGPALAIALAEQYGVELDQQQGFGTGLWAEIERRHRSERGIEESDEPKVEATVLKLEPPQPSLEAVPDPEPQLERLEDENRRLQDEIERLHAEFTQLRVIEPEPDPQLERLEQENGLLQVEVARVCAELAELRAIEPEPDPQLELLEEENRRLGDEIERLHTEFTQTPAMEPEPDPQLERLEEENRRLQDEIELLHAEFTKLRVTEDSDPEPEPELPSAHLLFVPTPAKYLLVERQGPPPGAGDEIALSEGSFVVGKVGRSPVPGEPRSCAFLLARA